MVASKMDITTKEKHTDITIGSKFQCAGNVGSYDCDPFFTTFIQVTAEKRTCKTGTYKKNIARMDKLNGFVGNGIFTFKLVICHFDRGKNLKIIGSVLFVNNRPIQLLGTAMCALKQTILFKL